MASMRKAVLRMNPVIRTIPPTCGAEMDSCITQRCFRPIFRPENIKMATAMVTTPMPPTWISRRITPCPKGDQNSAVSWITRPVTQVAEVAVNSASRKGTRSPDWVATGRLSRQAPIRI